MNNELQTLLTKKYRNQTYKDLDLVVDAVNMAAGATVYSDYYTDLEWVRNMLIFASTDQQFDIMIKNKDNAGTIPNAYATNSNQSAQPVSYGRYPVNGTSALLGYSACFGIKNSSAVPNTFGKLKVQLIGA